MMTLASARFPPVKGPSGEGSNRQWIDLLAPRLQRLNGWIKRSIWSHRTGVGATLAGNGLPVAKLYGEYELVRLIDLIPSLAFQRH